MYWESKNGSTPVHIQLCIDSVNRHKGNLKLHLLDQNSIFDYLPDLRPEWYKLKHPAHKADYIRTRLVYTYGGLWLDCDMIVLSSLQPLFDNFPPEYDYACQNIGTSIGCFLARPGCCLLETIIDAQNHVIDNSGTDLTWYGIGNELLKLHGKEYPYLRWKEWTLDEIPGGEISKLFSINESIEDNIDNSAIIFHLCNENSGPVFKIRLREARILSSNTLMSKIFRKALNINLQNKFKIGPAEFFLNYNFAAYIKKNVTYFIKILYKPT